MSWLRIEESNNRYTSLLLEEHNIMPSLLLSISRGVVVSPSSIIIILRRHLLLRKNIILFDASSNHQLQYYTRLSTVRNCSDGCRLLLSSSSPDLAHHRGKNKPSIIIESLGVIRSLSAASSSPNRRIESSSSSAASTYSKNNNHSAVDTGGGENNRTTTQSSNDHQKEGTAAAADWRTWFSSSEYDDPWSPYRPLLRLTTHNQHQKLQQSSLANNNSTTNSRQNTVVDNILTNYNNNNWERRRHGMNLVPLSLHSNNDNSPNNNLHSSTPLTREDDDVIHTTTTTTEQQQSTKLQKRTQWIDTQTRFTIQMLHDLYYTGIRRQMDRPTTERCHRLIGRLLSLTPRDGNVVDIVEDFENGSGGVGSDGGSHGNTTTSVEITGAAQRGYAILERMEWCSPAFLPQLRKWQRQQQLQQGLGSGGGERLVDLSNDESDVTTASSSSTSTTSDYHTNKVPKHLIQTKQAIPTPTSAIYNMVLLLYGKEPGSKYVAQQAEDVVWGMIVRGLQLEEFSESHSIGGPDNGRKKGGGYRGGKEEKKNDGEDTSSALPLYPNTQNWNCVLQCWSNSTDPNRAFFAYSFFNSWMEWNTKCVGREGKELEVGGKASRCDLDSFHLMLKSCVVEEFTTFDDEGDNNNTTTSTKLITQRAKDIGSRVAIGIWRDMRVWKDHNNAESKTLTSDTYHQLLRALCQTSDVSSRGLLATVAKVFQSCRSGGMETKEITHLVRRVMTETQFQKLLRVSEVVTSVENNEH